MIGLSDLLQRLTPVWGLSVSLPPVYWKVGKRVLNAHAQMDIVRFQSQGTLWFWVPFANIVCRRKEEVHMYWEHCSFNGGLVPAAFLMLCVCMCACVQNDGVCVCVCTPTKVPHSRWTFVNPPQQSSLKTHEDKAKRFDPAQNEALNPKLPLAYKIGRASCRERV